MAYDATRHFNNFGQNTSTNTHRATRNDIRTANNTMKPVSSFDNSLATTSTNIFVYSNGCIVGMIQSFNISEQRQVNKLQAIGWEGVVQAVPGNTNGGTLNVSCSGKGNLRVYVLSTDKTPAPGVVGADIDDTFIK